MLVCCGGGQSADMNAKGSDALPIPTRRPRKRVLNRKHQHRLASNGLRAASQGRDANTLTEKPL